MSNPLTVDLPHKLGAEEARRRIERNLGKLTDHIPGGARVGSRWTGDRLDLDIDAMGQQVAAQIDIHESLVRLTMTLPPALAFFSGMARSCSRTGARADVLLRRFDFAQRLLRMSGENCNPTAHPE
jgi:hypothetical protein